MTSDRLNQPWMNKLSDLWLCVMYLESDDLRGGETFGAMVDERGGGMEQRESE